MSLQAQCEVEDQAVWMTTVQAGFPTTSAEGELDNDLDRQWGKLTARCLHPAISDYILQRQQELSMQDQAPSMTESRVLELESEWVTWETRREDSDRDTDTDEDTTWEPNPLSLMVKHPPRVTVSNTKMSPDWEGFLGQTCPRGENDLGWVQLHQKSFRMGPTVTKVVAMARKDRRIIGVDTRRSNHHDTFIQNGMDNHEWDTQPPPKGLGSYPRHTSKDPGLM